MSERELRARIEGLAAPSPLATVAAEDAREAVEALFEALEAGRVRAAEPDEEGSWRVNAWVKQGILLAFRHGANVAIDTPPFHFRDRDTFAPRNPLADSPSTRIVPGGSTVRRGAHLGEGVVVMPPAFVNVGAFVGAGTMIDSHALVGSCSQIGARVHLSAAAQVGGVLEPVGAMPVVIEDEAFIGGGCGIYEGARVGRRAVLAPGVILTRAVGLYDAVHARTIAADARGVLAVPEGAVVVPGSRPLATAWGRAHGISLYAPVLIKYRDAGSDAATALEEAVR
jgi:2,3,4,5-tetrahydropyridine-2-carboxylate N-succinyltransferase